jgi:amidase
MAARRGRGELWQLTASEAVKLLKAGKVSPLELIDAAERRIAAVDPAVNALPTLCLERARARARAKAVKRGSLLAGLPVAIKDLTDVAGVRTTLGSPIFADRVPERSDILVERLEGHGGLVVAKSNTPEFGAGANTFNPVFGKTRNPWDTRLSAAGSSGGSAVALATGMVWLAQGSDMGGSLRTPAGFNSVVGLRPSPGRIASGPLKMPFDLLGVQGPMARTVADAALFLDALVGAHREDPIALAAPEKSFVAALARAKPPRRIGWSPDLGIATVDPEIARICAEAVAGFAALGTDVVEAAPDFAGAYECFQTLRAVRFAAEKEPLLREKRHLMKPDLIWNIEKGLKLTAEEIGRAERARAAIFASVARFFERHDLLATPVMQAPPYPVDDIYVAEIAGKRQATYIDWITITFAVTLTACPAISLPCGFNRDGLPVGLQLVAPPRGEARLLAAAKQLEDMLGIADRVPIDPSVRH